jgi:hypothetical protein
MAQERVAAGFLEQGKLAWYGESESEWICIYRAREFHLLR